MVKSLQPLSSHLIVQHHVPYITNYNTTCGLAGEVRFNLTLQTMEVFDGSIWQQVQQNASIGLTSSAESAMNWAIRKMAEEAELKEKMEKYPTLKSAYEQFKMVEALVHEEEVNTIK